MSYGEPSLTFDQGSWIFKGLHVRRMTFNIGPNPDDLVQELYIRFKDPKEKNNFNAYANALWLLCTKFNRVFCRENLEPIEDSLNISLTLPGGACEVEIGIEDFLNPPGWAFEEKAAMPRSLSPINEDPAETATYAFSEKYLQGSESVGLELLDEVCGLDASLAILGYDNFKDMGVNEADLCFDVLPQLLGATVVLFDAQQAFNIYSLDDLETSNTVVFLFKNEKNFYSPVMCHGDSAVILQQLKNKLRDSSSSAFDQGPVRSPVIPHGSSFFNQDNINALTDVLSQIGLDWKGFYIPYSERSSFLSATEMCLGLQGLHQYLLNALQDCFVGISERLVNRNILVKEPSGSEVYCFLQEKCSPEVFGNSLNDLPRDHFFATCLAFVLDRKIMIFQEEGKLFIFESRNPGSRKTPILLFNERLGGYSSIYHDSCKCESVSCFFGSQQAISQAKIDPESSGAGLSI